MAMMSRPEFMQSLKAHPEVWSKISSQALPVKCTRNDQIEHGEEIPALFEHQGLFPFLSLPLEIRNLIYTYLLSTEYTREDKIERITVGITFRHCGRMLIRHGRFPKEDTRGIITFQLTLTTFRPPSFTAITKSTRKPRLSSTTRIFSSPSPTITAVREY